MSGPPAGSAAITISEGGALRGEETMVEESVTGISRGKRVSRSQGVMSDGVHVVDDEIPGRRKWRRFP